MNKQEAYNLSSEIRQKIKDAGFSFGGITGANARAYMDAMELAIDEDPYSDPEHAIKVQVVYLFSNLRPRTPVQKELKKEMLAWAGS